MIEIEWRDDETDSYKAVKHKDGEWRVLQIRQLKGNEWSEWQDIPAPYRWYDNDSTN